MGMQRRVRAVDALRSAIMKPFHIRRPTHWWLAIYIAAVLVLIVSCDGGGGNPGTGNAALLSPSSPPVMQARSPELSNTFAATLTGAQEVPARQSIAQGAGTVLINPATRQMLAVVTTAGISGTAAHIHQGPTGVSGPIIFPLTETATGSGVWTGRAVLSDVQITGFRAGDYYFNVHSLAFADGEIRGQIAAQDIVASPSVISTTTFLAALRGTQEVPANMSAGQGATALIVNPVSKQLVIGVNTSDIAATVAHIHEGVIGVNGPILIPLNETPLGSGMWVATGTLTEAQFAALISGGLYVNVHTAALPAGEIRGQLFAQQQSGGAAVGVIGTANGSTTPPAPATPPAAPATPPAPVTGMTPAPAATPPTPIAPMEPATPMTPTPVSPGIPLTGY
jgi:CHRD domain